MKELQKHFTSEEQSNRLLKIGLPADSADCYTINFGKKPTYWLEPYYATFSDFVHYHSDEGIPAWSVGRLIEILIICGCYTSPKKFIVEPYSMEPSLIENIVDKIEELEGYDMLDFSKLNNQ